MPPTFTHGQAAGDGSTGGSASAAGAGPMQSGGGSASGSAGAAGASAARCPGPMESTGDGGAGGSASAAEPSATAGSAGERAHIPSGASGGGSASAAGAAGAGGPPLVLEQPVEDPPEPVDDNPLRCPKFCLGSPLTGLGCGSRCILPKKHLHRKNSTLCCCRRHDATVAGAYYDEANRNSMRKERERFVSASKQRDGFLELKRAMEPAELRDRLAKVKGVACVLPGSRVALEDHRWRVNPELAPQDLVEYRCSTEGHREPYLGETQTC